uniref:ATP synthase F0 subunit 8 n=1 Tax=Foraminitermes rhinoceros TaxID=1934485 RepID=A0A1S5VTW7_9NEOP|nr:ATP synthase F0 subunit 8 [Foraminitermes rhinoceros]AQP29417.1 ATP synthase F0 subunit 8 [Foraminitermes rhinoceros]
MPQMMPMEWTMLYTMFLSTFLLFNIMNYFTQPPSKLTKMETPIIVKKTNWKW